MATARPRRASLSGRPTTTMAMCRSRSLVLPPRSRVSEATAVSVWRRAFRRRRLSPSLGTTPARPPDAPLEAPDLLAQWGRASSVNVASPVSSRRLRASRLTTWVTASSRDATHRA
ncbi:MAG TPA: hypothetical protein VGA71_14960 [Actinomycetota bacterium]